MPTTATQAEDAASQPEALETVATRQARMTEIQSALAQQLIGHESLIERLLIALLCGGHLLLEGPPGVAKTRAIKRFSELLDTRFVRIQATPDLLPADMTGTDMFHQASGEFRFLAGPLFNNIVLVDEINRAPPKVQSALLEAMGEHQISTGGVTRALEEPFLVAATQNPIEHEGTYPLPEAQLDRFMFFLNLELPGLEDERRILDQVMAEGLEPQTGEKTSRAIDSILIMQARYDVQHCHLSDAVRDYIVRIVGATRGLGAAGKQAGDISQPASPRGSIFLAKAAQASAWLAGRDHVTPDDVARLAPDVLTGRIALDYRARAEGQNPRSVISQLIEATPRV